jgi:hypothetical protein
MCSFYRGVFEHNDGNRAMRMLNDIVDPDKATFGIYNCEKLFTDVWNGYFEQTATEQQVEERVDVLVARARAERSELPREEVARIRAFARDYILDHPARFEESRRHFFMIDLYPENAARFNLVAAPAEPESERVGAFTSAVNA